MDYINLKKKTPSFISAIFTPIFIKNRKNSAPSKIIKRRYYAG